MTYLKVLWKHNVPDDARWLYSELDDERWERRKIEVFPDGRWGFADEHQEVGGSGLGECATPSVEEINADPEFEAVEITREEFEVLWAARRQAIVMTDRPAEPREPATSYRTIRIDLATHSGGAVYFFVHSGDAISWDPWWGRLFSLLASFAPPDLHWRRIDLAGPTLVARYSMDDAQVAQLREVLRGAPLTEVAGHRTLRRAIEWQSRPECLRRVAFFRELPS